MSALVALPGTAACVAQQAPRSTTVAWESAAALSEAVARSSNLALQMFVADDPFSPPRAARAAGNLEARVHTGRQSHCRESLSGRERERERVRRAWPSAPPRDSATLDAPPRERCPTLGVCVLVCSRGGVREQPERDFSKNQICVKLLPTRAREPRRGRRRYYRRSALLSA